jgi:hypothetical protein
MQFGLSEPRAARRRGELCGAGHEPLAYSPLAWKKVELMLVVTWKGQAATVTPAFRQRRLGSSVGGGAGEPGATEKV